MEAVSYFGGQHKTCMIFIKIKDLPYTKPKRSWGRSILLFLASLVVSRTNPDYDNGINVISCWLLEFENEKEPPTREIGLDANDVVKMKMPYKNNSGYWTDNSLKRDDFNTGFAVEDISAQYFESKWNELK